MLIMCDYVSQKFYVSRKRGGFRQNDGNDYALWISGDFDGKRGKDGKQGNKGKGKRHNKSTSYNFVSCIPHFPTHSTEKVSLYICVCIFLFLSLYRGNIGMGKPCE